MTDAATIEARGRARGSVVDYLLRNPAVVCLGALVALSGAVQVALGSHLVLYGDEWNMVFERRGFSAGVFLDPHNTHLIAAVVAVYKLLLATFGMSSPLPFHVVSTFAYLLAAVLVFVYARRRMGDWPALFGTTVILFLGTSAVDILSPFQMFFSGSIAAGIGALLALDRDDRLGDVIACVLLVVATSFSEVGLAFAVGALVRLAGSPRPIVPRLYVPAVPLILFGIWWLGWGHTAKSFFAWRNVGTTPSYVLDAAATGIGAFLGLVSGTDQVPGPVGQLWAPVLLVAAVALAAWRVRLLGRVPSGVWPVLAVGLTFWALAGLNGTIFRLATNARYIYPSAVFILLIASELLRGVRPPLGALLLAAALTAVSVAANLAFLSDSYRIFWRPESEASRSNLRALEIAAPVNPSFVKGLQPFFYEMNAGALASAVDAWGSPAYSDSELAARPEANRVAADKTLGQALDLKLIPGASAHAPCRAVSASPDGSTGVELGPGTVSLEAAAKDVQVGLGRFSDVYPVQVGPLQKGAAAQLRIPPDASDRPWRLGLIGRGRVVVCGSGVTEVLGGSA
jgi:hypothetical protein